MDVTGSAQRAPPAILNKSKVKDAKSALWLFQMFKPGASLFNATQSRYAKFATSKKFLIKISSARIVRKRHRWGPSLTYLRPIHQSLRPARHATEISSRVILSVGGVDSAQIAEFPRLSQQKSNVMPVRRKINSSNLLGRSK